MNEEGILLFNIERCRRQCDYYIAEARKAVKSRERFAAWQAVIPLLCGGFCFYRLNYCLGIIDSIEALAFPILSWWIGSFRVRHCRASKLFWAAMKLKGEVLLAEWRGFRDRT